MPSGKPFDLCECIIHSLRVERFSSFKKSVLITEVAMMWASARDHDRVRNQIAVSLYQVSADRWNFFQCSYCRRINFLWGLIFKVFQKLRKCFFARPQENSISM